MDLLATPSDVPVVQLQCRAAFELLNPDEKKYAHYMSVASWAGAPIVFAQVSAEAPALLELFQALFRSVDLDYLKEVCVNDAMFYGNHGNYLSFGDSKFVPSLPQDAFRKVFEKAAMSTKHMLMLDQMLPQVYSTDEHCRILGYPGEGVSTYFSPNVTKDDVERAQRFMDSLGIQPYNTRLFKRGAHLRILIASSKKRRIQEHMFEGKLFSVEYGDHAEHVAKIVAALRQAIKYAADDNQRRMIANYVVHFETGGVDYHKESQRWWIKDIGPSVETNIGFVETYRDPAGVRAEFEGFVAMVNKETSKKFAQLVQEAPAFLSKLPWSSAYEKDVFLKPDFTSLEVLAFCTSGVPAGINIPNYDDIRQNEGFKNVSLGNVLSAKVSDEVVTFLRDEDQKPYQGLQGKAFEVQVGGHELLGHGSGKTFVETASGSRNFESVEDPFTKKPISSWYKNGATYDSTFGALGSTLEECRAECVGVLLSADRDFLNIFGFDGEEADEITYINWLHMARAGIVALEFYSPEQKKWRQAHMQARFAILQVFLEAGEKFVQFDASSSDPILTLDRSKITSVGISAVEHFLHKIQVYKATANVDAATKLYEKYTSVNEKNLRLRETVMAKKKPRRILVQSHTRLVKDDVELIEFDASTRGMIESFKVRFSD